MQDTKNKVGVAILVISNQTHRLHALSWKRNHCGGKACETANVNSGRPRGSAKPAESTVA